MTRILCLFIFLNVVIFYLKNFCSKKLDEEEQVLPLEIEGYCLRTVEEDETAVDEPLIPKKDDKKKGKKGK